MARRQAPGTSQPKSWRRAGKPEGDGSVQARVEALRDGWSVFIPLAADRIADGDRWWISDPEFKDWKTERGLKVDTTTGVVISLVYDDGQEHGDV